MKRLFSTIIFIFISTFAFAFVQNDNVVNIDLIGKTREYVESYFKQHGLECIIDWYGDDMYYIYPIESYQNRMIVRDQENYVSYGFYIDTCVELKMEFRNTLKCALTYKEFEEVSLKKMDNNTCLANSDYIVIREGSCLYIISASLYKSVYGD